MAYDREGRLSFWVSVPDFFALRPLLRAAGSRPRVLERRGLPFKLGRLSRRKTFAGGLLLFVAALFALSTLVWDVQIHTDETVPEAEIRKAAAAEGIRPLQWSPRLPDATELAHRLARRLPDAAWVGVEKSGTRYVINVIRSNKPEVNKESGPSDLIAKADAVVTRIVAESGKPLVARNARVRKGETLISGQLGEADRVKLVASAGEVRGARLVRIRHRVAACAEHELLYGRFGGPDLPGHRRPGAADERLRPGAVCGIENVRGLAIVQVGKLDAARRDPEGKGDGGRETERTADPGRGESGRAGAGACGGVVRRGQRRRRQSGKNFA
ncbi:sporulation protein YqfD [Cohnella rhizosphaerae]|uniref:Sporulation protein YqfD n=1 Tax=Cohnella rhizosphaerae TaxID=1457232 RepID=A0A9X4KVY9_9BACL|nr:sporulation protein YqfD [Cohnella rhizosphaerae]MDG0812145.1 sporulation protein YqfD [Cohnella rhizosphaerae]